MAFDKFTLASVVRENGRSRRDNIAIVDGDRRVTYGELAERVEGLAHGLVANGLAPGERLLWLGQNSGAVIELLLACSRIGAVFCAANWRQSPEELASTIRDFRPAIVVTQPCEVSAQFAAARQSVGYDVAAAWIDLDPVAGLDRLLEYGSEPIAEPTLDAGVYALYTAAFDGRPQAAVIPNVAILFQNLILGRDQGIGESSVFLNSAPMFHIGMMMTTFAIMHHGGTNVIVQRVDADMILDLVERERCTHAFLMAPTLTEMKAAQAKVARDLTSLWPSGEVERPIGILTMPPASPMFDKGGLYGQSETCGIVTAASRGGGGAGKATLAEICFFDDEDREVPDGEVGEIAIRSPLLMNGYFGRDSENAHRRRSDWHHTRDLGRRRADGGVDFIGPKGVLIKSAAENIYPAEVEVCLRLHPAVLDACVIGVPDTLWGQSVKAVIQLRAGASSDAGEIIAHCKDRIASYKKPRLVAFVDALPRTGAGFIDRAAVDAAHGGGGYPQSS